MKVKLIGKAHREGISTRTGKPYNIITLHCMGTARNVEGQAVMHVTLNGAEHPYDQLPAGSECVVEYDSTGALVDFQPIAGPANNGGAR